MTQDATKLMSQDSIEYLEDAKKGKPRKFAMICKGPKILSLVVYKKGSIEAKKKEAKESGRGDFYFGIIDGKGVELTFKLARADGFESAPVKTLVLKEFLSEEAGLKARPLFEIVDVLGVVLDEADPLVQRFLALQPAALTACDSQPDRAAELNSLCTTIGKLLDQDERDTATGELDKLEALLKELGAANSTSSAPSTSPPSTSPSPTEPTTSNDAATRDQLNNELKALVVRIKDILAQAPNRKDELLAPVTSIKELIASGKFQEASALILQLKSLLDTAAVNSVEDNNATANDSNVSLEDWQAVRSWAINGLKEVAKTIAQSKHPESSAAIIMLKAVIANLTEAPTTAQQVAELKRYLETDDVVFDVCQFALDIRTPLLDALA